MFKTTQRVERRGRGSFLLLFFIFDFYFFSRFWRLNNSDDLVVFQEKTYKLIIRNHTNKRPITTERKHYPRDRR